MGCNLNFLKSLVETYFEDQYLHVVNILYHMSN